MLLNVIVIRVRLEPTSPGRLEPTIPGRLELTIPGRLEPTIPGHVDYLATISLLFSYRPLTLLFIFYVIYGETHNIVYISEA